MNLSNTITVVGVSSILVYTILKLVQLFGVSPDSYMVYLHFTIFVILSYIILPNKYNTIQN